MPAIPENSRSPVTSVTVASTTTDDCAGTSPVPKISIAMAAMRKDAWSKSRTLFVFAVMDAAGLSCAIESAQ